MCLVFSRLPHARRPRFIHARRPQPGAAVATHQRGGARPHRASAADHARHAVGRRRRFPVLGAQRADARAGAQRRPVPGAVPALPVRTHGAAADRAAPRHRTLPAAPHRRAVSARRRAHARPVPVVHGAAEDPAGRHDGHRLHRADLHPDRRRARIQRADALGTLGRHAGRPGRRADRRRARAIGQRRRVPPGHAGVGAGVCRVVSHHQGTDALRDAPARSWCGSRSAWPS